MKPAGAPACYISGTENKREEDPKYFYHILPYATVLGLETEWSKHFDNIHIPVPEALIPEAPVDIPAAIPAEDSPAVVAEAVPGSTKNCVNTQKMVMALEQMDI